MNNPINQLGGAEGVMTWAPPSGLSWAETVETAYGKEAIIRLASRFAIKDTPDGKNLVTSSVIQSELPQILIDRKQRTDTINADC